MDDDASPKRRSLQRKDKLSSSSSQISCKICNKTFYSSQALGGHQNAHRQERLLEKARSAQMEQPNMGKQLYLDPRLSTTSFTGPFYGQGLNLNGFHYQNKLGVSMNSMMIHKASFHSTRSVAARPGFNLFGHHQGHRYGYWMQPTMPAASKVFENPKFEIVNDNNNGLGEGQEDSENISRSYVMNKQLPQASEELDLTLKL